MYKIMMYAGTAGVVLFFLLSVFLFIKNKVPSTIMYFINLRRKGVDIWSANKKQRIARVEKTDRLESVEAENNNYEPTELLDDIKENLESTELLPDYSEK